MEDGKSSTPGRFPWMAIMHFAADLGITPSTFGRRGVDGGTRWIIKRGLLRDTLSISYFWFCLYACGSGQAVGGHEEQLRMSRR